MPTHGTNLNMAPNLILTMPRSTGKWELRALLGTLLFQPSFNMYITFIQ